ncbi:MAG: hypothetical protein ACLVJO_11390 [[Clostridium] scindens]
MIREVGSSAVKGMIDTATLGYSGNHGTGNQGFGRKPAPCTCGGRCSNGHLILGEGHLDIAACWENWMPFITRGH